MSSLELTLSPNIELELDIQDSKLTLSTSENVLLDLLPALIVTGSTGGSSPVVEALVDIVIDIDSTNADDGITDPLKFVTASAAYAKFHSIVPYLNPAFANKIKLLFGNGDYSMKNFIQQFLEVGRKGPTAQEGSALMDTNATVFIEAKNAPSVISKTSWTAVGANNKTLISDAFNVAFRFANADKDGSFVSYANCCIPMNVVLDGVAFIFEELNTVAYMGHYGSHGVKGYAVYSGNAWWGRYPAQSPITTRRTPYTEQRAMYDPNETSPTSLPVYLAHTTMEMIGRTFVSTETYHVVNSSLVWREGASYGSANAGVWLLIGTPYYPTGFIWNCSSIDFHIMVGCEIPSGTQFLTQCISDSGTTKPIGFYTPSIFTGVSVGADNFYLPTLKLSQSVESVITIFTGGVLSPFDDSHSDGISSWLSGTVPPNGAQYGKVGDVYTNRNGGANTTLWRKESGDGTNTGWVAVSNAGGGGPVSYNDLTDVPNTFPPDDHQHVVADITDFPAIPVLPVWYDATLNLPNGAGVYEYSQVITNAAILAGSYVVVNIAPGLDTDENQAEGVIATNISAIVSTGQVVVALTFPELHSGPIKIKYQVN